MAARGGLIRRVVAAAFAIAGVLAIVVALHDLYRASAPSARVVAGLVGIAGAAMLYAALPLGAGARMREAVHLVAAIGACGVALALGATRFLFAGPDASIVALLVAAALFAAVAWVSRDGWTTLRGAPLRLLAAGGLLSVSAVLSVGKTIYTGIHPALVTPVTLNLATELKPAGTKNGLTLVSGTITLSNPTGDRVNVVASQYYVAALGTPGAADAGGGCALPLVTMTRIPDKTARPDPFRDATEKCSDRAAAADAPFLQLRKTGVATSQEWLNGDEASTTTFVASIPRGEAAIGRLYATAVVARGDLQLRAVTPHEGYTETTYEIDEPSWLLRYTQGRRRFRATIVPAQEIAGGDAPKLAAPQLGVGAIASQGGILGRLRAERPISGGAATASAFDAVLSGSGK